MNANNMQEKIKNIIIEKHIENFITLFRETRQDIELEQYLVDNKQMALKMIKEYIATGNVSI